MRVFFKIRQWYFFISSDFYFPLKKISPYHVTLLLVLPVNVIVLTDTVYEYSSLNGNDKHCRSVGVDLEVIFFFFFFCAFSGI